MLQEVQLKVEGMNCTNCAMGVTRVLEGQGLEKVYVDFASGDVSFETPDAKAVPAAIKGIQKLGYSVKTDKMPAEHGFSLQQKFFFSLAFTVPLLLHMFIPWPVLHSPYVQLVLSLPVIYIGAVHFGRSAWMSLRSGVPNMDVLITIGSGSAFLYSVAGMVLYGPAAAHAYIFFETAASIITLVLLGNLIEHISVKQTTSAISELSTIQVIKARKYLKDLMGERIVDVNYADVKPGDILVVNTGDKVPADGSVVYGEGSVDESLLTGESFPVDKTLQDRLISGTVLVSGSLRMKADKVGKETLLSQIIQAIKNAQLRKPAIQRLGDKVSAVFVPVVLGIAALTFLLSYFLFSIPLREALMHSVAVLVISCPCAMGLATPTAVMVGLGKAARKGIVIKGGDTLEKLARVDTVIFDKTGTLTTGNFKIKGLHCYGRDEAYVKGLIARLEQGSSHPIAVSLLRELEGADAGAFELSTALEHKGLGISAEDVQGNRYQVGSYAIAKHISTDDSHSLYLLENDQLIATVDIQDEMKPGAAELVRGLKARGLKVMLMSGDKEKSCKELADKAGISEYYSQCTPQGKLDLIDRLSASHTIAMVGDGINDAPALARASVGVSMGNATSIAVQSAQVILLKSDNMQLVMDALLTGRLTLRTIKQNLFWAFFYNIAAIPIAALGLLNPMIAAFAMGLSDVVVIGNSLRIKAKRTH